MIEETFILENSHLDFINRYQIYGFKNKSDLIQTAIEKLKEELDYQDLQESAQLYAEIYEEDKDLQNLTESALLDGIE